MSEFGPTGPSAFDAIGVGVPRAQEDPNRQALGQNEFFELMIAQLTQPTLAIRAAESNTLFPQAWTHWQKLQPDATFVELPDCGHMLTLERPSQTANIILNYLNRV